MMEAIAKVFMLTIVRVMTLGRCSESLGLFGGYTK